MEEKTAPFRLSRGFRLDLTGGALRNVDHWVGKTAIKDRVSGASKTCDLRFLHGPDLDSIMALQARVVAGLEDKTLFRPLTRDLHAAFLGERGCTSGAFIDGQLIGYAALQFPVRLQENQGLAIGLRGDAIDRVCQMEGTVVEQRFRSQHVARLLSEMRVCRAAGHGYTIPVATISPFNGPSLASFVPTGLMVKGIREGEGSLLRYYVSDDLRHEITFLDEHVLTIPTHDIPLQKHLIAEGWWGFRPVMDEGVLSMQYARFRSLSREQFHQDDRAAAAVIGRDASVEKDRSRSSR